MTATLDVEVAELRRANAELQQRLEEGLAREAATAEILRVVSGSPIDVQPTFDAIATAAVTLTNSALSGIVTYDGTLMHIAALYGFSPKEDEDIRGLFPIPADRGTATGRAIRTGQVVQIEDMSADPEYGYPSIAGSSGQTVLAVPMLRDGNPIGAINVQRRHVEPFTDQQIDLFKTFADQAVIAIENVRLFNETQEALEQQTATAEVLQVINSSPGNLGPVFDEMLEKAVGLCDAAYGVLRTFDGEFFHLVAMRGEPDAVVHLKQLGAIDLGSVHADDMLGRIVRGEAVVHIADIRETHTYRDNPVARERAESANQRTWLAVALRRDTALLGVIMTYRAVVRPFSDKQIALLQNFAAQAVVAMENARLLTETREALEQQTATAEVLQVINSSPGDLAPVFDAIVEKAHTLCNAVSGSLQLWDGERFRGVAMRGFSQAMVEALRHGYIPGPKHPCRRLLEGARVAHCLELAEIDDPVTRAGGVAQGGVRTILFVALRKDDVLLGQIVAARREVRPFSEKNCPC
jgi:GAF domain-containing protein